MQYAKKENAEGGNKPGKYIIGSLILIYPPQSKRQIKWRAMRSILI